MSCSYEASGCVFSQCLNILSVCVFVSPWWSFSMMPNSWELSFNARPNLFQSLTWRCMRSFSSGTLLGCRDGMRSFDSGMLEEDGALVMLSSVNPEGKDNHTSQLMLQWVAKPYTAKTLGLLQPHFRLSQLDQCDQGMTFSWNSSEVLLLELTIIISQDPFDNIPGMSSYPNQATKELYHAWADWCVRSKQTWNLTRNAECIWTDLPKRNLTLIQILSFMCHTHKRIATEGDQNILK